MQIQKCWGGFRACRWPVARQPDRSSLGAGNISLEIVERPFTDVLLDGSRIELLVGGSRVGQIFERELARPDVQQLRQPISDDRGEGQRRVPIKRVRISRHLRLTFHRAAQVDRSAGRRRLLVAARPLISRR
jgi:hypothetical protein